MSDRDVLAALDDLERLLAVPMEHAEPGAIGEWHERFRTAVAGAERGPGWPEVLVRAKLLGRLLKRREAMVVAARDSLKRNLEQKGQGRRALTAYGAIGR